MGDSFTTAPNNPPSGTRICGEEPQQLAPGDGLDGQGEEASRLDRENSSVVKEKPRNKKGRFVRERNTLGKYPFSVLANQLLRDTAPWYSESTRQERGRKFRRIHDILQELRHTTSGEGRPRISTTSPRHMTEEDVIQFMGWCKEHLDNATTCKYVRYLGEILQAAGNGSLATVKLKHKKNLPRATPKSIRTLSQDAVETLLRGQWELEDPHQDIMAKAALGIYIHTGMRSSEVRLTRLRDLDLLRGEVVVSSPKGQGAWASGKESAPLMPGAEATIREYLAARSEFLAQKGFDPEEVEPLFPHVSSDGSAGHWSQQMWNKLKSQVERASSVRFKWKDLRPTFAQAAKDAGVPIEEVSKALRHTSTLTTERFYSRVRSETAFSHMRQLWEAAVVGNSK